MGGWVVIGLVGIPGLMICERCLVTERAVALKAQRGQPAELSADEFEHSGDDFNVQ